MRRNKNRKKIITRDKDFAEIDETIDNSLRAPFSRFSDFHLAFFSSYFWQFAGARARAHEINSHSHVTRVFPSCMQLDSRVECRGINGATFAVTMGDRERFNS